MNDAFAPLYSLLSGHFGWLPTLIAWIGALRIPLKFVNGWLQAALTQFVVRVQDSPEMDDDAALRKVMGSLWYRFLAFTLDAVISLKLPTTDSLTLHRVASNDVGKLPLIAALALLGTLFFGSGCSTTNIAELTKALANDPAIVVVKVGSVYGTINFARVGSVTNGMTISPDGTISVK